jgi:hypothetical protein
MSENPSEILRNLREVFVCAMMQHAQTTIAQSGEREFDITHAARKLIEIQTGIEAVDRAIANCLTGAPSLPSAETPAEL